MIPCRFCGHEDQVPLPLPHPTQSMLSDGRIWPEPLAKTWCPACGATAHVHSPDITRVRRFYEVDYDLGREPGTADTSRNRAYTELIRASAGPVPSRVLEIGCGPGQTLVNLAEAWPKAHLHGLEAAARLATRTGPDRVTFAQGFVEDLGPCKDPYDLVYAINVIEHAADPVAFLKAAARQLAPKGRIILICPAASPPNLELVFLDHIHTLTPAALTRVAGAAGLSMISHESAPDLFADFQLSIFARGGNQTVPETGLAEPGGYLAAWQGLEALLETRLGETETVDMFGAGEMAALLRCYAPAVWRRVRTLLVDDLAGARALDRPVRRLDEVRPAGATVVATRPHSQSTLAQRLRDAGHFPIVFNDVIAC